MLNFKNGKKLSIYTDKCYEEDINKGETSFDVFTDSIQIAKSTNIFLKQIYNINNISDVVNFLNNSLDILPIYSQRRLLKAIFEVYFKYIEFPKLLFSKKIMNILNVIYKINKLDEKEIMNKLNIIEENSFDIYKYLSEYN
jgi:hypothetical protein